MAKIEQTNVFCMVCITIVIFLGMKLVPLEIILCIPLPQNNFARPQIWFCIPANSFLCAFGYTIFYFVDMQKCRLHTQKH